MKKIFYCFLIVIFFYSGNSFSQISQPIRLTNGNNDRNPSFCTIISNIDFGYIGYEFMVFERVSGAHSQICVSKIGPEGSIDSTHYLTNDSSSNTNPAIFYNKPAFPGGFLIKLAFVVWQSDKFGRESIFGSFYDTQIGWSEPFVIDSSNADNKKPSILGVDDPFYIIAYESGNDIKYKKFDRQTHETAVERNLTQQDPEKCSNPQLTGNINSVYIAYEKEISATQKAIYYRSGHADSIPYTGNITDTLVFTGDNHIVGYGKQSLMNTLIYETNKNGNVDLYLEDLSNHFQYPVVVNNAYDNLSYAGTDIVITDAFTNYIYAYIRKAANTLRFIFAYKFSPGSDVLNLNISSDPFYRSKIIVGNGVVVPELPCQRLWFVYNKDSVNLNYPSVIFGIPYTNCVTEIIQNNISHLNNYSLFQNYPNPFNPVTHLEFGISDLEFVSLKVYDVLGNEIKTLVYENKSPGTYSIEFDGSNLPSGIYYYKITAGKFSEVKKMTLLK